MATFEPKRRGLWFKLLVGFGALVLVLAGWLFLERLRGQAALRKYEKELIAKRGEADICRVRVAGSGGEKRSNRVGWVDVSNGQRSRDEFTANAQVSSAREGPAHHKGS